MADTNGNPSDPLTGDMASRPWAFDFYRAVRMIECQRADLPRVGYSLSPAEDPLRFWQKPSFRFAPSAIESITPGGPGGATRVGVTFFGLFGPNAPLPPHITEYVFERELHHHDPTITAFFNLFNHRLLSLFYRAWAVNQKALDLDRPKDQRFATYVGAIFGIGMDALADRDAVPDAAKLFFSGRLASQTRNAEGLEAILRQYFNIPAEVQPFTGRWLNLPPDSLCSLGQSVDSGCLGVNTIIGQRFWDSQLSFRMKFGPMKLEDYERMLPKGEAFERLKHWVLNYCGEHFFWDAQLSLLADEVPPTRLGQTGVGALSVDDLTDLPSLAAKLSGDARAGSLPHNLWNQLSAATKEKLRDCLARGPVRGQGAGLGMGLGAEGEGLKLGDAPDPAAFGTAGVATGGGSDQIPWEHRQAIVEDINRVLRQGLLQAAGGVDSVVLSAETRAMLERNPGAAEFPTVNRRLLEDVLPREISRHRRPGGLGWSTWLKTKSFSHDAEDLILNPPPE